MSRYIPGHLGPGTLGPYIASMGGTSQDVPGILGKLGCQTGYTSIVGITQGIPGDPSHDFHIPRQSVAVLDHPGNYPSHGLGGDGRSTHSGVLEENSTCTNFHQSPHPLYEPLQYPLFFPHGTNGWFPGMMSICSPSAKISQLEYYRHLLLTEVRFGLLGRLLNEYLVDMFSSIEDSRLNYIRQHVQTRIAARRELDETINAEGGARAGRVYLPSSFMGSPRMQRKLIADGLAVVRRLGKPTYFITITCNPNWPEIRDHPEMHGQSACDRPDLTCRVFRAKLHRILEALRIVLARSEGVHDVCN